MSENNARTKTKKYIKGIWKLVKHKVKWYSDNPVEIPDEVFVASVDGMHCQISEIRTDPNKDY